MDEQAEESVPQRYWKDLRKLLNQRSIDNYTNIPDFLLADMVAHVLNAAEAQAAQMRMQKAELETTRGAIEELRGIRDEQTALWVSIKDLKTSILEIERRLRDGINT